MPGPLLGVARRDERGLLREPTQPEHECHKGQEDQHAQADHLRGVPERRGGGVLARVLHDLPHVPVLTDAGAREPHQAHQPGERDGQDEQGVLGPGRHFPPADRAQRLGAACHEDVDHRDEHDTREHRQDLIDAEPDAHDRFDEVAADAVEKHARRRDGEQRPLDDGPRARPRHHRARVGPAVQEERQKRGEDHQIHGGILGAHHAEGAQERMVRPTHGRELLRVRDHGVGCAPHDGAEHQHDQQVLGVGPEPLRARNAAHADPQIVVARQEQHRDEERLDHPQPAHEAAHHGDPHRLVVLVDLASQPVAGERQHDERRHRDEVPDVAHPVVVGPFLVGARREKAVARVRAHDRAAEHHVRDHPVHVDRHPGRVGDRVPQLDRGRVGGGRDVPGRRHHVREPRIRDEHHDRAPHVEQDAERPVAELRPSLLPTIPPVVVQIQGERLDEEQRRVQPHRRREDRGEVGPEAGIQGREAEHQHRPPDRRRAVRHEQEARELLAQPVVALVAAENADRLGDHGEHRHTQHERGEHQVHLGRDPDEGARAFIWITAEVHLMFAAFVLGVPMFAVVTEAIGIFGGDERYDRLSKEFTRLLLVAYSATAIWGAMLVFGLSTLYPRFWAYLTAIFAPSMWLYAALFLIESFTLYLYYYGWDRWKKGRAKLGHWTLGILLNVWGTIVMFIANSWLTYMMSPPRDITPTTDPTTIKLWHAIANATWMPINVHRVIANVVFGGAIVGAYASYRFLAARTEEERAHYDWMGYVGNFIAMSALIVLPFAGYWLGREIYQYDQSMGITMMGGFMSWLGVILSFLLYRRANKRPVVPWARTGTLIQGAMFALAAGIVLFYGIRGYFVEAIVRIGFSVYQVLAVLGCILCVTVIDILMARGAQSLGVIKWGQMPPRSQYALFILAVTFTWLMVLMGFARSGIRQYWHVCQVGEDTSKYAATPPLGYASKMISVCVLIFLCLVSFVFWLGGLAEKSTFVASGGRRGGAQHVGH